MNTAARPVNLEKRPTKQALRPPTQPRVHHTLGPCLLSTDQRERFRSLARSARPKALPLPSPLTHVIFTGSWANSPKSATAEAPEAAAEAAEVAEIRPGGRNGPSQALR